MSNTQSNKLDFEKDSPCLPDCTKEQIKEYFLRSSVYHNNYIPDYYNFTKLLNTVYNVEYSGFNPREEVNYIYQIVKKKNLSWRNFYLLNPVVYTKLVKLIIEEMDCIKKHFETNKCKSIKCASIPRYKSIEKRQGNQPNKADTIVVLMVI